MSNNTKKSGDKWSFFLNNRRKSRVFIFLTLLAAMGIKVEAVITDHYLSFVGYVGSHSRYELKIVYAFFVRPVF
jgi:hypothetical protein